MSLLQVVPKFLYPTSRQFPFDEVAEKIVRAIEKRNWKVPGLTIEFDTYGSGEAKYQLIRTITGDNFKLYFSRIQGRLDRYWNNSAALYEICIPNQIIKVYEDESGPTYYLYVGKDWEADKDWFMNSIKVNSKLNKEPRRYLKYSGNTYCRRAIELVSNNDLDREYSPKCTEPTRINLSEKFDEFTTWLEKNVLEYILTFEEADIIDPPIKMEELIPYSGSFDTIFSICTSRSAETIKMGKNDVSTLCPEDRHASFGSGQRLVPLGTHSHIKFPKIANEGFIWCDVNQNIPQTLTFSDAVLHAMSISWFDKKYLVSIKLKYANHVYVIDNAKFEETRQQLFKDIAPREKLTDKEYDDVIASRGATIIPITEYKGDYKEPLVLISRELDFDEVINITPMED